MEPVALGLLAAYLVSKTPCYFALASHAAERQPWFKRRSLVSIVTFLIAAVAAASCLGSRNPASVWIPIAVLAAVRFVYAEVSRVHTWWQFLLSEVTELLVVVLVIAQYADTALFWKWLQVVGACPRTYGLIVAYAVSVGLGAALVPRVTATLNTSDDGPAVGSDSISGAGRCIGVLERLIITSLIIYMPDLDVAAIGLIFGAKSIARFPEFKKTRFAEYYLVGSLTSFTVAIVTGLLARFYLPAY